MGFYDYQKDAKSYFGWTPAPKVWFEFVGWLTVLSTLQYISIETDSFYLNTIYWFSYIVLFNSIQKGLWSIEFQKYLPSYLNSTLAKLITYLISITLVTLSYLLVLEILADIMHSLDI